MTRLERSLAGSWQFQTDPEGQVQVGTIDPTHDITVPMPWQAAFPELQQYSGYAWYRCDVELDDVWLAGDLILHFGAVDYWCEVYVNRQLTGQHEGGYTPFDIPIRAFVQAGHNEIAVRVYDTVQDSLVIKRWHDDAANEPPDRPPLDARQLPHGKQEWYLNVGGIWQDVTLIAVPDAFIDHVAVTPDIHTGDIVISVELGGALPANGTLLAKLGEAAQAPVELVANQSTYTLTAHVDDPRLWTPDTPSLYTATIELTAEGVSDSVDVRFGFREITTRDGQLLLNGEPLFLLAALDQDFYPETIYTLPSEAYLRDQFLKAKALGLNCLRCHIKPPDPRYLDLADELGLLIWEEIPSWRSFYVKTTIHPDDLKLDNVLRERVRQTLHEMIRRDFNHPALVIWTIVNEDWGTALPLRADDREWLAEMSRYCKQLDPTRLVVDNSACGGSWGPNIHVESDLDDFHVYFNIPDHADDFRQTIEQFALRPLWTYSSHGDAHRTGHEPMILSEFGNWGLPSLRSIGHPAWFDLGPWWSSWEGEPGWPCGVEDRFKSLGLDAIWPDYEAFAAASQWHQFAALKFQIETMRREAGIAGYVITELTDIYWESNGLLDFERHPKVFHDVFSSVNASDVIVPEVTRYAYWSDETIRVRLDAAHYSAADWTEARLHWDWAGKSGDWRIPEVAKGSVKVLGSERFSVPQVVQTQMVQLQLVLSAQNGQQLASNTLDVLVLPSETRTAVLQDQIAVMMYREREAQTEEMLLSADLSGTATPSTVVPEKVSAHSAFAQAMSNLGYRTTEHPTPDMRLLVTDYPDAAMLQWVRDGGDMLYLCSGAASPFFWRQGRGGTYSGNWITSFSWLRPGIYRRLNVTNPLSMPFMHVMPDGVILGLPVEDASVQQDFLAGQIAGWLHHPAVHTVQFRYGKGRVIMTTFALRDALLSQTPDPVGVAMFHDLIEHLASDACQPVLTANY